MDGARREAHTEEREPELDLVLEEIGRAHV